MNRSMPVMPRRVPWAALLPGTQVHQVQAQRVGTVFGDQLVRGDLCAPALAHLGAFFRQDHPLVAQTQEGFALVESGPDRAAPW